MYMKVPVEYGDKLIPSHLLALKSREDYLKPATLAINTIPTRSSDDLLEAVKPGHKQNLKDAKIIVASRDWNLRKIYKSLPLLGNRHRKEEKKSNHTDEVKERLLEILDPEMDYLDTQGDYEYRVALTDDSITLSLNYLRAMPYYPKKVNFIYSIKEGRQLCTVNGHEYVYQPDLLRRYINEEIAHAVESGRIEG
jgi:hypothetical protein